MKRKKFKDESVTYLKNQNYNLTINVLFARIVDIVYFLGSFLLILQSWSVYAGSNNIGLFSILQEFPLHELFTHEVPLVDIDKAFELLKDPTCVKVVIKMWYLSIPAYFNKLSRKY